MIERFYLGTHRPNWLERTREIGAIASSLAGLGLRLHGFGVKTQGLARYAEHLVSADSMAWSLDARRGARAVGHEALHRTCANCMVYAGEWRERLLRRLDRVQLSLHFVPIVPRSPS